MHVQHTLKIYYIFLEMTYVTLKSAGTDIIIKQQENNVYYRFDIKFITNSEIYKTCCLIIKTEAHNYIRVRKFLFYLPTLLVLQVEIP